MGTVAVMKGPVAMDVPVCEVGVEIELEVVSDVLVEIGAVVELRAVVGLVAGTVVWGEVEPELVQAATNTAAAHATATRPMAAIIAPRHPPNAPRSAAKTVPVRPLDAPDLALDARLGTGHYALPVTGSAFAPTR